MGLFVNKKREDDRLELPPMRPSLNDFPKYESISQEFTPPEIPLRKTQFKFDEPKPNNNHSNEKKGESLFVHIDKYREVMHSLDQIKKNLLEAEEHLSKIQNLRKQELEEIDKWRSELDILKEKLSSMYKTLFDESPW